MRTFAASALNQPPFPARVNKHVVRVAGRSAQWAADFGLAVTDAERRRLSRANGAELAGRACPDADPKHLVLVADLVTWLFAFDDRCDEDGLGADPSRLGPVVARLLDIVDLIGDKAPEHLLAAAGPSGAALHDLGRRVRATYPARVLLRFTTELRDYLLALLWEAANRAQRRVPVVSEYIQMRRYTGAVYLAFALTDAARGAELDTAWLADSRVSKLDLLAADLICWSNDMFSYEKERATESDGHNLALAITAETGLDDAAALAAVAQRFNDALDTFLRLGQELLAGGGPRMARYISARRCWVRASYDWSLGAARYHHGAPPADLARTGCHGRSAEEG